MDFRYWPQMLKTLCRIAGASIVSATLCFLAPHATAATALGLEENKGQFPGEVLFRGRASGMDIYLHSSDIRIALARQDGDDVTDFFQLGFVNANRHLTVDRMNRFPGTTSYFRPTGRVEAIETYGRVALRGLYPGIDAEFYGKGNRYEFDLAVHPGGDPSVLSLSTGSAHPSIAPNGDLVLRHECGTTLTVKAPEVYQRVNGQRRAIAGAFVIHDDDAVGFDIGKYDSELDLIIDPILDYLTYIDGSGADEVSDVYVDSLENRYVVGSTTSPDLPPSGVPVNGSRQGTYVDVFVAKYDRSGAMTFLSIIGGANNDIAASITADDAGFVYATGRTLFGSASTWIFPTTPGAYRSSYPASGAVSGAIWVAKLNPNGTVNFAALVGGSYSAIPVGIGTDLAGNVYVGGQAGSATAPQQPFPTTAGAYSQTAHDLYDGFVFRLTPSGGLLSSTLFGAAGAEDIQAFAVNSDGTAWIGGSTKSASFPVTPDAYQSTALGGEEGFLAKFSADGSRLLYATYLRSTSAQSNGVDRVDDLALDRDGNVYAGGYTLSSGFPTTPGVYSPPSNAGFIAKFDASGALKFSARMPAQVTGLAVDGGAIVAIGSAGPPFPTVDATQSYGGSGDGVVMRLSSTGTTLQFSTFVGGASSDLPNAVAMSPNGNATVVGTTYSTDMPVTPGAAQTVAKPTTTGGGTGYFLYDRSFLATFVFDRDGDGLLDTWEENGIDVNDDGTVDLDLPALGANAMRKDVFVEIDYMSAAGHTHRPGYLPNGAPNGTQVLGAVVGAFGNAPVSNPDGTTGVTLHLLIDESIAEQTPIRFTGANADFNRIKNGQTDPCTQGHFGTAADRANSNCRQILSARRLVFRYALFAHSYAESVGSSGIAEMPGNDFIVSLRTNEPTGGFDRDAQAAASFFGTTFDAEYADMQAGTLMHELGHTLGLHHGGGMRSPLEQRAIQYKPNYLSVMSYSRQFNRAGRDATGFTISNPTPIIRLNRTLDYSRSVLNGLNEGCLNDSVGVGGPAGQRTLFGTANTGIALVAATTGAIDWDGSAAMEPCAAADVNRVSSSTQPSPGETLLSHDDWSSLVFSFRASPHYQDGVVYDAPYELTDADVLSALLATRLPSVEVAGVALFDSGVPGTATITISVVASDPDGQIAKVEFYANGLKLGEDASSPFVFQTAAVPSGIYELWATATDNSGAAVTSPATIVNVAGPNSVEPVGELLMSSDQRGIFWDAPPVRSTTAYGLAAWSASGTSIFNAAAMNDSDYIGVATEFNSAAPGEIRFDAGSSSPIREVELYWLDATAHPELDLQYSDDGASYTTAGRAVLVNATFDVFRISSQVGPHRYWRLAKNSDKPSQARIAEIRFRTYAGTYNEVQGYKLTGLMPLEGSNGPRFVMQSVVITSRPTESDPVFLSDWMERWQSSDAVSDVAWGGARVYLTVATISTLGEMSDGRAQFEQTREYMTEPEVPEPARPGKRRSVGTGR